MTVVWCWLVGCGGWFFGLGGFGRVFGRVEAGLGGFGWVGGLGGGVWGALAGRWVLGVGEGVADALVGGDGFFGPGPVGVEVEIEFSCSGGGLAGDV